MRVSDIWQEIIEATGTCDEQVNYRALTRAVELLANKGLFDPLLGTIDFSVDGGHLIALPRDVKTPLRLNINNNPAFSRTRLFEFSPNSEGSVDGPEIGWQWHERGYSPIQDERKLPSALRYVVTASEDIGKSVRVRGVDVDGRDRTETLLGAVANAAPSQHVYGEVRSVTRETTAAEAFLYAEEGAVARYYPDEEVPEYRIIKLSQTGVAVRMVYRKHVFKLQSQEDLIPLHSSMAVIRAVDAVRLMQRKQYDDAKAALEQAAQMIGEEQSTRDENTTIAATMEIQSVLNANLLTNDVLLVADVYDMASDILGPVGRAKLFDRITDAVNALSHKAQWDSLVGDAVVARMERCATTRREADGYFVLPRHVGAVLALDVNGSPAMPRNRWFEFHVNGTGETRYASAGTWDDAGDTCIINRLPSRGCRVTPAQVVAVPDNALDEGKLVTIYGMERRADGREVEVWRDGRPGWVCPCRSVGYTLPADAPAFTRIDRITREATTGFVRLIGYEADFTTVAIVGDTGRDSPAASAVAALINRADPAFAILAGDTNYFASVTVSTLGVILGNEGSSLFVTKADGATVAIGDTVRADGVDYTVLLVSDFSETAWNITLSGAPGGFLTGQTAQKVVRRSWSDYAPSAITNKYAALHDARRLLAVPGNHDWGDPYDNPNGLGDFSAYFDYLPNGGRYYVKTVGDVDFFMLDSDDREPDGNTISSVQHAWLAAQAAASTAKWKVAVFHHTAKTSGSTHSPKAAMQWDFATLGIHAVVAGHNHVYERIEEGGVLYFTAGAGSDVEGFGIPSPYSLKRAAVNGALFVRANARSLLFQYRDLDGNVVDERELTDTREAARELLLGYWYPDELEPRYRMIKVPGCCAARLRMRYRKRTAKISSLYDVINLRSRLALENMLRALAAQATDPATAQSYEAIAVNYLEEEQQANNPHGAGGLQFDPDTAPGFNENIQ